jgi:DNA-binding winged helix-turn-helix (wHTH) protein
MLGDWAVRAGANRLECGDRHCQLEPLAMDVLVALCARPGEILSAEELAAQCWGDAPMGDNPVHKAISQLRRALGDSATEPRYIETIRKRGYRVLAPVRSLDGGIEQARDGAWTAGSPFRGLLAFDQAHAQVFYGREAATRALLKSACAQLRFGHGLCLVLGPSGSGKTSLVLAGLMPALLRTEGFDGVRALSSTSLDLGDVGAQDLLTALAASLLDWELPQGKPMFPGASAASLAVHLTEGIEMVLGELDWALKREAAELSAELKPIQLLFIDRLEALFVSPQFDAAQRTAFLDTLDALAASGQVLVLAACRNDFYPRLAEYPQLMRDKAQGAHFDLAPPTQAEIAQMIRLPARAAGLSYGVDAATQLRLDDVLCDAAADSPDALPLLQYTLEELYRQRSPHGELSFAVYEQLGGLEGAIGRRAENLVNALPPAQQQALPHVLSLLVTLAGESRVTGRRALLAETQSTAARELVQALVDARLVVSDAVDEQAGFRVAHEAILRRWPRVTEWIAAHEQALQLRSRLRGQVRRWLNEGRSSEYLLPKGKQLSDMRELLGRVEFSFSADEQDFVQASQRRARLGERLRVGAVAGIAVLALLAGAMAWRANSAEHEARARSTQADDLLGYMLGDFADKLRPIGRLELLDSVGSKALDYLAAAPTPTSRSTLERARALTVIGEVRVSKRELDAALPPLQAARRLLAADPPAPELAADWRKAQGTAAFWVGHAYYSKREFAPARAAWEDYRRYSEQWLAVAPGQFDPVVELSYAQNSLGSVLLDSGDLAGAARQFRASLGLKQQALLLRPQDLTLKADWMDSLSWLGTALLWQGEFQQARQLFAEGLQGIASVREASPKDLEWISKEAEVRTWLGLVSRQLNRREDAQAEFSAVDNLMRELLEQDPKNRKWAALKIRVEIEKGMAPSESRRNYLQRLRRLEQALLALNTGASASSALSRLPTRTLVNLALADELQARRQGDEASQALETLSAELRKAIEQRSDDLKLQTASAQVRLALAELRIRAGATQAAHAQCAAVLDELDKVRSLLRVHFEITQAWVKAQACLGQPERAQREQTWLAQRMALQP